LLHLRGPALRTILFVMLRNAPDSACRHYNNHMLVEDFLCARFSSFASLSAQLTNPPTSICSSMLSLNIFGLIYGSRLGQALARVRFVQCEVGAQLCSRSARFRVFEATQHVAYFLRRLGSCRDRRNAEADRYRCVILTATGRFVTYLAFCMRKE